MKGPVECMAADQNMDKSTDFSEYMWMAEQNLDEFDKEFEEEFVEELRLHEALSQFEDQQEAALYAQENLYPPMPQHHNGPRQYQGGYNQHPRGRGRGGRRHHNQHMNGFVDHSAGNSGFGGAAFEQPEMFAPAPAVNVASSTLNPNAQPFVFNPNAQPFVPSWMQQQPPQQQSSQQQQQQQNSSAENNVATTSSENNSINTPSKE